MNWTLIKRWIGEGSLLLVASAIALFAFAWVRVWVVTQLEMGSFEVILEQVWDKYEKYSPVPLSHLLTYHGRVGMAFSEPIIVLCVIVWTIARGSDAVAGHLGRGVMEMLLAQPLRRWEIVGTQTLVNVVGAILLCLSLWAGVSMGIINSHVKETRQPEITIPGLSLDLPIPFVAPEEVRVPLAEKTKPIYYVYPSVNLFCLAIFLGGLATLLSSLDRYRWRTIGIVAGFVIAQMMLRILCLASEQLHWLSYFTIFSAYEPEVIVRLAVNEPEHLWSLVLYNPLGEIAALGPSGYNLILLLPGVALYGLGTWIFCRRDLPAPL